MQQQVFLVHGWSVQTTQTYQALHQKLAQHGYAAKDIYLGRYVSLDDEVEVKDLARAMHEELLKDNPRRRLGPPPWTSPFHIITHSTGALVVKHWIVHYYSGAVARNSALKNVIFLAGPHFGSRLAHHGRSMLARARFLGPTGRNILRSLELGSAFSWTSNREWLDAKHWRGKGIRPYCLIGRKVISNAFASRIFPAGYEKGSDMVVRVASGNLNFRRFRLNGVTNQLSPVGDIHDVPFGSLYQYSHSGDRHGIMNNITNVADPKKPRWQNLRLILNCLAVDSDTAYAKVRKLLRKTTQNSPSRQRTQEFAQLDFRFVDETGSPILDYRFEMGAFKKGRERPSKTIAHTHRNKAHGNHFTAFINLKHFEPALVYFFDFNSDSNTPLYKYHPDPYRVKVSGTNLRNMISANQTTQIEVTLGRRPSDGLFQFHPGTDPKLHVTWDRTGQITKTGSSPK